MKEYIERDKVRDILLDEIDSWGSCYEETEALRNVIPRLYDDVPAADVVERKRGEWVEVSYWKYKNGHSIRYTAKRCSVCGADVGKKTQYNGCPYCFADMRSNHGSLCDQTEEG